MNKEERIALKPGRQDIESEKKPEASQGLCLTLCNHWSYIGIGWQMGIESCVLSVIDALELADRQPHVKTCLNLDARAFEFMAEKFPEVVTRLKKSLAEGEIELIGGSYGQPMGTMFSGESNIRQIVVGRETIRRTVGYELVTFLEEEEFSHPQLPQILIGAGFRYASLGQLDTWGRAGCPTHEFNAIHWKGIDGTTIPTLPKNTLIGFCPDMTALASSDSFKKLRTLGKPLMTAWQEFGWESPEQPAYLTASAKFKEFAEKWPVEFVTCTEYLDKHGSNPKETIGLPMDAWDKSLTWGLGGDQLRIMDRKVDALLQASERFDAVASTLGAPSQAGQLEAAWKDLMASQSHDVGLCEYSRWHHGIALRMAPLDRIEDYHNFTWGAIGYNHLDSAQKQGQAVLNASVEHIVQRINSAGGAGGARAVTVLNPSGWPRSDLALTGRIYPISEKAAGVVVKNRAHRVVPSQIVKAERDPLGNLLVADVAFVAEQVPSVGYDTYYLEFTPTAIPAPPSSLHINEPSLVMENEHVKVRLEVETGAVTSLVNKRSGHETLDPTKAAFPTFTGKPDRGLRKLLPHHGFSPPPVVYDSSKSKAKIDWIEQGPVRATVRAQHHWSNLIFETRTTLTVGLPYVEVLCRVMACAPPQADVKPAEIHEGYWLSFAPAFQPVGVFRDFPLAVERAEKAEFHALTFVDLVGKDRGLLVLHAGTQWFRKDEQGVFSNLLMREWASHFDREFGWPVYAEYRHALMPHDGSLTNADRLRTASNFTQPLITKLGPSRVGDLPAAQSFVTIAPDAVQLLALRQKAGQGLELRVIETEGHQTTARVELGFPLGGACETNLLGAKISDVSHKGNCLRFATDPWKIRTFALGKNRRK